MKKILILLCLIVSFAASAESYKYMYSGRKDADPMGYMLINRDPVILNFLTDLSAVQVILEGESLLFYIADCYDSGREILLNTVLGDGRKARFSISNEMTIFVVGDYSYVITDIPKSRW